jgi:hypothetical protein
VCPPLEPGGAGLALGKSPERRAEDVDLPRRLKKIGAVAFAGCRAELNSNHSRD